MSAIKARVTAHQINSNVTKKSEITAVRLHARAKNEEFTKIQAKILSRAIRAKLSFPPHKIHASAYGRRHLGTPT